MPELVASLLVAALRQYVATGPNFLCEVYGDDVYAAMRELTTLATGDEHEDYRYWEDLYEERYVR